MNDPFDRAQNNSPGAVYVGGGDLAMRGVHVSLMGDPTLRMHPVKPLTGLTKTPEGSGMRLRWTGPMDEPDILGYSVYVRTTPGGPFMLRDDTPTSDVTYYHEGGSMGATYMVRVVKREADTNGTAYYNSSQGVFI